MTNTYKNSERVYVVDRFWTEFGNNGLTLLMSGRQDCIPPGDFVGLLSQHPRMEITFREIGVIDRGRVFQAIGNHTGGTQAPPLSLPLRPLVTR